MNDYYEKKRRKERVKKFGIIKRKMKNSKITKSRQTRLIQEEKS